MNSFLSFLQTHFHCRCLWNSRTWWMFYKKYWRWFLYSHGTPTACNMSWNS